MCTRLLKVLLADDHPALRLGLRVLLEQAPEIKVVGEADNGTDTLTQWATLRPDVVVLDCELPGLEGPMVALMAQQQALPGYVLALSSYTDDRYVRGMLEAGANGYILKEEAPGVIVAAVRAVGRGEKWFSQGVLAEVTSWKRGEGPAGLTDRELEVLRLMVLGESNKEIGHRLGVTERTVAFHVTNLLQKLGMESRIEAVVWAKERGVVP